MPRLFDQLSQALAAFRAEGISPALIGGLALSAHNVVRATQDIDFLVDGNDAERIHQMLLGLGYECIHRSGDAANYLRGSEGLDLLYAHRPVARELLDGAVERETAMGKVRVVDAEGLIAFKLQGYTNDPRRLRDLDDIRQLLSSNRGRLDLDRVREYFCLFGREALLDEILAQS